MHREVHETSSLRDAAGRDWQLVISREISEMPNQAIVKNVSLSDPKRRLRTSSWSSRQNRREAREASTVGEG